MLNGDVKTGKTVLRDYINATVGFGGLADRKGGGPRYALAGRVKYAGLRGG
jgi:ABC-type transporter lipoprotein component MlaA